MKKKRELKGESPPVEVIGMDHIYISVSDLAVSEAFYDKVMPLMGFLSSESSIGGAPHIHYFNRHFGYTIRPAINTASRFDSGSPGLHHFCFRVDGVEDVDAVARGLDNLGIEFENPKYYPEFSPDYYAVFFADPDGILLEVTNFRKNRRERSGHWEKEKRRV